MTYDINEYLETSVEISFSGVTLRKHGKHAGAEGSNHKKVKLEPAAKNGAEEEEEEEEGDGTEGSVTGESDEEGSGSEDEEDEESEDEEEDEEDSAARANLSEEDQADLRADLMAPSELYRRMMHLLRQVCERGFTEEGVFMLPETGAR